MFREAAASLLILATLNAAAGFAAGSVELLYQPGAPISQTASGDDSVPPSFNGPQPVSLSADGRYAVFLSAATNLMPGQRDLNGRDGFPGKDVFLADLAAGTVTLVSHAMGLPATTGNLASNEAAISADGRWIAFTSAATNLVPGQPSRGLIDFGEDVLLYDRVTGTTSLLATSNDEDAQFTGLAISADGRYVTFTSSAADLIPGEQTNGFNYNVYLYDRVDRSTRLVSHLPGAPLTGPEDGAGGAVISADGRYVVFLSSSADLLPGQITGESAILYDRTTGALSLVGGPADGAEISADGQVVAFSHFSELRTYDRATGATVLVSSLAEGTGYGIPHAFGLSADGRYLTFLLLDQSSGEVHPLPVVYDRISRVTTPVSRASAALPINADVPRISADGRFVVFASGDKGWIAGQTGTGEGVYLFDRAAGKTSLLSHVPGSLTTTGNDASYSPAISANGSRAVYYSLATDLEAGLVDLNFRQDLFACDIKSSTNRAVTLRAPDLPSLAPVGGSRASSLSADGRYVAFERASSDPARPGLQVDVLLYDAVAKATVLVNHVPAAATTPARGISFAPVVSADGRTVAFYSTARNLVASANANGDLCLFLYDRITGAVTFVARNAFQYGYESEDYLPKVSLSADGHRVAFVSDAPNVVPGQQEQDPEAFPPTHDVFLFDRDSGALTLVSHAASSPKLTGAGDSDTPRLSADGRWLLFLSDARDLLPGLATDPDAGAIQGAFLYDRQTGALTLLNHPRSSPLTVSPLGARPLMSDDGRYIVLATEASDLDPSGSGSGPGIYFYDRAAGSYTRVASYPTFSFGPDLALSGDGRILALPGYNGVSLYDRVTRTTSSIFGSDVISGAFALNRDGRYLVFESESASLVPGLIRLPGLTHSDIFLYDRVTATTVLVDQWQGSAVTAAGEARLPLLSADGQRVAFTSDADLVAGDYNRQTDAYLFSLSGSTGGGGPVTVPPCILFDSHRPADGVLRSNVAKVVKATGVCGVPAAVKRVTVKVTAFQGTGKGNVRLYPGDLSQPSTGILRFSRGQTRTATFDVPVAPNAGTLTLLPFVAGNGTAGATVEVDGYTP